MCFLHVISYLHLLEEIVTILIRGFRSLQIASRSNMRTTLRLQFEIRKSDSPALLFSRLLCYTNLRICVLVQWKMPLKFWKRLYWICTLLRVNGHFNNINSSNLWTQTIFLFTWFSFSFVHQCIYMFCIGYLTSLVKPICSSFIAFDAVIKGIIS